MNYNEAANSLEIYTTNPRVRGSHNFEIKLSLQDYPVIKTSVFFDVLFDDPCEIEGYAFIDVFEQEKELTFRYSGSGELYASS